MIFFNKKLLKPALLVISLLISLTACSATPDAITQDRRSRADLEQDPAITLREYQIEDFTLHYAVTGAAGMPTIVFVHGTPGSWRSLGRMMVRPELQQVARMVSIDRPGWGDSLVDGNRSVPDFQTQSELIAPLLYQLKQEAAGKPLILVGHSYGGSIAPYLAYIYPDIVDGLLMAASAIDPVLGKPRWYNYAARIWPISRLIRESLQIANDEIWGVAPALEQLEDWWETAQIPMIFVQGEEDELVDPRNLDFAENRLPEENSRVVRLARQGHLLHIQQRDLLSQLARDLLDEAARQLAMNQQETINTNASVRENTCTSIDLC